MSAAQLKPRSQTGNYRSSEVSHVEYANLSVDEIQQQLEEIEQSKAELQRALVVRRQEAKHEVAQQVRDLILQQRL